jgi:hypothetical protein
MFFFEKKNQKTFDCKATSFTRCYPTLGTK